MNTTQNGLNELITRKIANAIDSKSKTAMEAIKTLEAEGKAQVDFIASIGAKGSNVAHREVNFSANGHVKMDVAIAGNGTETFHIHDNAISQLGKIFMANKQEDGVAGESTLWKLVQGVSAEARTKDGLRERELQIVAGDLMSRVF
ncbi:MAG: hypothetical protein ACOYMF_06075 [Bacteroidales bacterium]